MYLTFQNHIPIIVFLLYSLGRGIMSAIETPVRQAVLPDLTQRLTTTNSIVSLIYNKYMSFDWTCVSWFYYGSL